MPRLLLAGLVVLSGLAACTDAGPDPTAPEDVLASRTIHGLAANRVTAAVLWNRRTREIIGRRGGNSNDAARTYALVSVAQYNAVIAAEDANPSHRHRRVRPAACAAPGPTSTHGHGHDRTCAPSKPGAVAAASATVLTALYPAEQSWIEAALDADEAYFRALPEQRFADFDAGAEAGLTVAAAVLAHGAADGSDAVWSGMAPQGPGYWIPAPAPAKPSGALWGAVRPWLLASGDQFRSAPPPAVGSSIFLEQLAEVRTFSDTRTAEQLEIAQFWAGTYGPGGPAGYFGDLAGGLVAKRHLDERHAAGLLAVLHMAIMDASIGCYDAKYTYWYVRPYQVDPAITTPVGQPNFPSYPSAHSCLSAAAAGVLAYYFPSASPTLAALVEEAGLSRIYGGIHFGFDITAGRALGEEVAALAVRRARRWHAAIPLD